MNPEIRTEWVKAARSGEYAPCNECEEAYRLAVSDERARGEAFGYVHCACRDCTDVAVGLPGIALCDECEGSDCQPVSGEYARGEASWQNQCQRDGAYDSH